MRRNIHVAGVVGDEDVIGVRIELFQALHAHANEADRQQHACPRSAPCDAASGRCGSNSEATMEQVHITMVESTISGVEKSRERRKLIASPQS